MEHILTYRHPVLDPNHYDQNLWTTQNYDAIQNEVANRLYANPIVKKRIIVSREQIVNVLDSISQSKPHIGTDQIIQSAISYITSYIINEETVNQTPEYDKRVLNYDGTYGIQRMATGEIGLKKKQLNKIGRMFF